MRPRIRHNHIAAMSALAALLLLIPAYILPFMAITSLGRQVSYSIIGSIGVLLEDGHTLLAAVIFTFSFIFPIAKLLALLVTITTFWEISASGRKTLQKIISYTGKYSMLDVLVAAVLVVAVKLSDLVEFRLLPGTSLFCISILLSILAGQLMDFTPMKTEKEQDASQRAMKPVPQKPPARVSPGIWPALAVTMAILVLGIILLTVPVKETVDQVTLLKKQELMPSLWPSLDKPDYFLKIRLKGGKEVQTDAFDNTPIGNGLIWPIHPVFLREMIEITVLDRNIIQDEALDRVNVNGRENTGMYYEIRLGGPHPKIRTIGLVLAIAGAAALILAVMLTLRRFVI